MEQENKRPEGQTFGEKAANFWYYYKWYVVVGVLLLLTVIVGLTQCIQRVEPDMRVLLITSSSDAATQPYAEEIQYKIQQDYLEDYNGDGKVSCYVSALNTNAAITGTTSADVQIGDANNYTTTMQQSLVLQLGDGQSFLILCDDASYQTLRQMGAGEGGLPGGVLQPLEEVLDLPEGADPYRVSWDGTALGSLPTLQEMSDRELYLCLRVFDGSGQQDDEAARARYTQAVAVLEKILADQQAG